MNRRQVLKALGLGLAGLQVELVTTACSDSAQQAAQAVVSDPDALAQLRTLASELQGIDFVGPACAVRYDSTSPLSDLLTELEAQSEIDLEQALEVQIQSDFRAGRVIDIDGWQMARSECMFLAGAAVLQGLTKPRQVARSEHREETFLKVLNWGPSETIEGEVFNPIGNGRGGFWVQVDGRAPASVRLVLDGKELATHFQPGTVTASLEPDYMEQVVARPGLYELKVVDTARGIAQPIGFLKVRERPPYARLPAGRTSTAFCEIERWGPDHANQGAVFNEQPDGSAAFWVRIGCAPPSAFLTLDGRRLPTSVRPGLVTARVLFFAELDAGDHRLELVDPESGETLPVGTFRIL